MKTFRTAILVASAAVLCWGCGDITEINTPASINGLGEGEILASIDARSEGQPGKAGYKSNLRLDWEAGEEIKVGEATYRLIEGAGSSIGKFAIKEGYTAPTDTVNCFAPADLMDGETGTWPASQGSADAETTTPRYVPLGARTSIGGADEGQIYFSMLGAVMCFELSNRVEGGVLETIRIESEVEPISGPFTVEEGTDTGTLVAKLTGGSPEDKVITYTCPANGKYSNIDAPKRFFVSIPAGSYTKLTVTFTSTEGNTATEVLGGNINPRDYINVSRRLSLVAPLTPKGDKGVQLWDGGPFWSPYNIGARYPDGYGDYYAWGACEMAYTQLVYTGPEDNAFTFRDQAPSTTVANKYPGWDNYEGFALGVAPYFYNGPSGARFTKYNSDDRKSTLELEGNEIDDAARVIWGGLWHVPAKEEFTELIAKCYWVWCDGSSKKYNGKEVEGWIVYRRLPGDATTAGYRESGCADSYSTSSCAHIFLPAAGRGQQFKLSGFGSSGYYWSSAFNNASTAYAMSFSSEGATDGLTISRGYGMSIRPVSD